MLFNRALTAAEIAALYNGGSGTEDHLRQRSMQASYTANGWNFDTAEDFAVKVDFNYSDVSAAEAWAGLTVGDDVNYVSISSGSDGGAGISTMKRWLTAAWYLSESRGLPIMERCISRMTRPRRSSILAMPVRCGTHTLAGN